MVLRNGRLRWKGLLIGVLPQKRFERLDLKLKLTSSSSSYQVWKGIISVVEIFDVLFYKSYRENFKGDVIEEA